MARVYQVGNSFYSNTVDATKAAGAHANATNANVTVLCCTLAAIRVNLLHLAMLNGDRDTWCAKEEVYTVLRPGKIRQGHLPCEGDEVFDDRPESPGEDDDRSDLVEEGTAGP